MPLFPFPPSVTASEQRRPCQGLRGRSSVLTGAPVSRSWDALYTNELANHAADPSDKGTNWFDDSGAQDRIVEFLEEHFSSSSRAETDQEPQQSTAFLDLGTGNGELLFALREAGWHGRMLGVDYSERSVELARRIEEGRQADFAASGDGQAAAEEEEAGDEDDEDREAEPAREPVEFVRHDILLPPPTPPPTPAPQTDESESSSPSAWPLLRSGAQADGWDVLLDKGTFDAVSLSSTVDAEGQRTGERGYRAAALRLVRPGGLFLITSCNWTEAELEGWFAGPVSAGEGGARFEKIDRIQYRSFSFGGVKGQTISTLCFRKVVD